jgi:hypothetical protein
MIDLEALARGHGYRTELDPSARGEPLAERPWHVRIPCWLGFISVYGPATLAAYTGRRNVVARLAAVPGVRVHQRGTTEVRVLFDPSLLDAVAETVPDLVGDRQPQHAGVVQGRVVRYQARGPDRRPRAVRALAPRAGAGRPAGPATGDAGRPDLVVQVRDGITVPRRCDLGHRKLALDGAGCPGIDVDLATADPREYSASRSAQRAS